MATRTVKSTGGGDHTTINAAIAAVVSDQGGTDFDEAETIEIFELGDDYTDVGVLLTTLLPTVAFPLTFLGIDGSGGQVRWALGSGINLKIDAKNVIVDNIELENDGSGDSALDIGTLGVISGVVVKECLLTGLDSGSAPILLRCRAFGGDDVLIQNCDFKLSTRNGDGGVRLEGTGSQVENCFFSEIDGGVALIGTGNKLFHSTMILPTGTGAQGWQCLAGANDSEIRNVTVFGSDRGMTCDETNTGMTITHNNYFGAAVSDTRARSAGTDLSVEDFNTNFSPLEDNSISLDPVHDNTTSGSEDGHIGVGSPLVGAGVAISGIDFDKDGTARGTPPSIGAFEPLPVLGGLQEVLLEILLEGGLDS